MQSTEVRYDTSRISFAVTARSCRIELPLAQDEQVYGLGLQFKGFNHKNRKLRLCVNFDPVANTGDSHASVPFFVTTKGYGVYVDTARNAEFYCGYAKVRNHLLSEE